MYDDVVMARRCSIDGSSDAQCAVIDCEKPVRAREWCVTHYHRFNRNGDPLKVRQISPKKGMICTIDDCRKPVAGRSMCQAHYRRWNVHGDPRHGGHVITPIGPHPCPIPGCTKFTRRLGLCTAHHQRLKAHGDPNHGGQPVRVRTNNAGKTCNISGCSASAVTIGLCFRHYKTRWYQANPERRRTESALRRMRKIHNGGGTLLISERDWHRTLHIHRHACAYCHRGDVRLEVEHVIPLSRGGRHTIGNIVPACGTCNRSKGSRLLSEWRYRHGRKWRLAI